MSTGRWKVAAALGAATLALAACGGHVEGGAATGVGVPAADYAATATGNHWVYADAGTSQGTVVHAAGNATLDGRSGVLTLTTRHPLSDPWQSSTAAQALVATATGGAQRVPSTGGGALDQALGTVELYRLPASIGDSFVQADKTVDGPVDGDGDGIADRWTLHSTVSVVGMETVVVAAGRFDDCLHLRTVISQRVTLSQSGQTQDTETTRDDWYAPGIGPVRMDTVSVSGPITGRSALALVAYRVGTRSSDASAPTIAQITPGNGFAGAAPATVTVVFSEAVDPASARAGVALLDGNGQAVAGSVSGQGGTVVFTPQSPLGLGHYAVQVAASVTDVAGNALGSAVSAQFDVTSP